MDIQRIDNRVFAIKESDGVVIYDAKTDLACYYSHENRGDPLSSFKNEPNLEPINFVTAESYKPTSLTILPSLDCNLGCRYCYSDAIPNSGKHVSFEAVQECIDSVVANCDDSSHKISISFHGGGEPLYPKNHDLIEHTLDYCDFLKEKGFRIKHGITTNGTLSDDNSLSILRRLDHISLSLDGPPTIQNYHRPTAKGATSSNLVERFLSKLGGKVSSMSVRATISDLNVNLMKEMVDYFLSIGITDLHFEPLSCTGRALGNDSLSPARPIDFYENYIEAVAYAKEQGASLTTSADKIHNTGGYFCGAHINNFFLVPGDYISTCIEACDYSARNFNDFCVGKYEKHLGKIILYPDSIARLQSRNVDKVEGCDQCIARNSCGGGCSVKVAESSGDIFKVTDRSYCEIKTRLFSHRLYRVLSEGNL